MNTWNGKSKGTPLGYRIFVFTLRRGGVRSAYILLYLVVTYYFLFSWKASKNLYYLFRKRLGFSILKSVNGIFRNYYRFGQAIIDRIAATAETGDCFTFNFDGEEYLEQMVAEGNGGLLLGAHLGNWEIAGFYLKRIDTEVHVVMYEAESEKIRLYLDRVTGGRKMKIIPIKDDLSHVYLIAEALRNNGLVCIHADRFLEGNRTISRTFLGKPALFPEGVFMLAATFGIPVAFVFALKDSPTHYHFFSTLPKVYKDAPKQILIDSIIGDYVTELENKLQRYPYDWFNYFKFWV